jgi:hypothetical protein
MKLIAVLLSSLLALFSATGLVVDRVAEQAIRNQLDAAESLQVRVDNTPSYQLLQGKVDRIRIAGRGLFPYEDVRIDTLDIETDAIALDPQALRSGNVVLDEPVQATFNLVLTEADVNQALRSPAVQDRLLSILGELDDRSVVGDIQTLINPQVDLVEPNQIDTQVELPEPSDANAPPVAIVAEIQFNLADGSQLEFLNPVLQIDGEPLPDVFGRSLVGVLNEQADLTQWEEQGITVRLLDISIQEDALHVVGFIRMEPAAFEQMH